MSFISLDSLDAHTKEEFVASLAALIVGKSSESVTGEALEAVAAASGNTLSGVYASLWASAVNAAGGVDKYCAGPGSGGGDGSGGAGGGAAAAEVEKEEEKEEEEEEMDMAGGIDMFGGDEGGGGGDY
jgi:ribosomal protein L12E/L44/L45/RPP1/RPP2